MLFSAVPQSASVTCIHVSTPFWICSPFRSPQSPWVEFPVLHSMFSWVIYFTRSIDTVSVNPNFPIHHTLSFPCWCPCVCSNHAALTTARDLGDAICVFRRWQSISEHLALLGRNGAFPFHELRRRWVGRVVSCGFPARSCHTYASALQDSRLLISILPRTTIHFPAGHFLHF